MIRRLRRRHRMMTIALAVLAPSLLILALALRAPVPTVETLLDVSADQTGGTFVWRDDLWNGAQIRTGIAGDDEGVLLAFESLDDVDRPDSMLYYASTPFLAIGTDLPRSVFFLGALSGARTVVRKPAIEGERYLGQVILYNLAENKVVGWAPLAALAEEAGL